jgi:uncharacterized membrane protein YhdT
LSLGENKEKENIWKYCISITMAISYNMIKYASDYIITIINWNEKPCKMRPILYIIAKYITDYIITITVEIRLKNAIRII